MCLIIAVHHSTICKSFIDNGEQDTQDNNGNTAIHRAIMDKNIDQVNFLLKNGLDSNI